MPIYVSTDSRESAVAEPVTRRRSRRSRGIWLPLVGIVLVIAAIVVVADRVAAKAASNELKSRIETELVSRGVTYSSLDVQVEGTPFLTQVAEGRYDSITIDMTEVRLPAGLVDGQAVVWATSRMWHFCVRRRLDHQAVRGPCTLRRTDSKRR